MTSCLCISQSPKLNFYSFIDVTPWQVPQPGLAQRAAAAHRDLPLSTAATKSTPGPGGAVCHCLCCPTPLPTARTAWLHLSLQGVAQVTLLFGVYLLIFSPFVDTAKPRSNWPSPVSVSALQSEDWASLPLKISLSQAWAQRDHSTAEQRRGKSAFQVRTAL